jgi:multidrug efflux pump subunit AcrA (membrane-fusion protein)
MSIDKKRRILLPAVATAGLLVAVLIVVMQPGVEHLDQKRLATAVSTVRAQSFKLSPYITGFGTVTPDKKLNAKAEVSGRIRYLHPDLKKGALLAKGTVVVIIDDVDYQLSLRQAQADLAVNQANLSEFDLSIKNTEQDLKLAQEKLKITSAEYQRKVQLKKNGTVSQSAVDTEYKQVLGLTQETQNLENKLSILPSQKDVLRAKIASSQAKVQQQERNLARTEITLPFNGRIGEVEIEQDQYVGASSLLFTVQGIDKILINAQFSIEKFNIIAQSFQKNAHILQQAIANSELNHVFEELGLTATVMGTDNQLLRWQGKVERISESIDPQSRTLGVVISVSDSYKNLQPGVKPPLMEGMYMEVQLNASADDFIVIPRFALHEKELLLVDENNELERMTIKQAQLQGELVLLKNKALIGRQVVSSDLFPAVPGMLLDPIIDTETSEQIERWIKGE